ncbi:hypothetical protein C0J52_05168, partial [Blattella germanica]
QINRHTVTTLTAYSGRCLSESRWEVIPSAEKKLSIQVFVFWKSSSTTRRTVTSSSVGSLKLYLEMMCGHMESGNVQLYSESLNLYLPYHIKAYIISQKRKHILQSIFLTNKSTYSHNAHSL